MTHRLVAATLAALATGCASHTPDNKSICAAFAGQGSGQGVVAQGTVTALDRDGAFFLQLTGDCDLLLHVTNSPAIVRTGETVDVEGTYGYAVTGGELHATAVHPTSTP